MTTMTVPEVESLSFKIEQEIRVRASLEVTFAALLDQLGSGFEKDDGTSMPFKLEAWPGGRWFRDLGNGNGHCWATVQAIKRPTLLEFSGPLMMSFPVANNVQYRLSEECGETLIKFHHTGFGIVPEEFKKGMRGGWTKIHEAARQRAESSKS
ncbi:MAG: SRPBCC family protein [Terracidiphilus sp.]